MGHGLSNLERDTERKALGTVWVVCPYPVVARGLEELLKTEARVHVGPEPPPVDQAPSSIILWPDEAEDVASEVKRLREMFPRALVLVFGSPADQRAVMVALGEGASGYLHAEMEPAQIVEAVSLVGAGEEVVIPQEALASLVGEDALEGTSALTPRQREILELVAEGLSNAEVAGRLCLSEATVKQHLRLAYKMIKVKNRTEAARLWSGPRGSASFQEEEGIRT